MRTPGIVDSIRASFRLPIHEDTSMDQIRPGFGQRSCTFMVDVEGDVHRDARYRAAAVDLLRQCFGAERVERGGMAAQVAIPLSGRLIQFLGFLGNHRA